MNEFERRKRDAETVEAVEVDAQGKRWPARDGGHDRIGAGALGETARRQRTLSHILYGLYAASHVIFISAVVAVIIDIIKRGEVNDPVFRSHATWRIRTFWGIVLMLALALPLVVVQIGWWLLPLIWIWGLYRVIKGWLRLLDGRPMYMSV